MCFLSVPKLVYIGSGYQRNAKSFRFTPHKLRVWFSLETKKKSDRIRTHIGSLVHFLLHSFIKKAKIVLVRYSLSSLMPDSSLSSLASSFMLRIWYSKDSLESPSKNSFILTIGMKKALKDLVISS